MQAQSPPKEPSAEIRPYSVAMPRKLSKPRPRHGARLASLRLNAGLSQAELAKLVGESQRNIAYWEQADKPPRSDVLPKLARVLDVKIDDLLDVDREPKGATPVSRAKKIFDDVQRLPRRQQDRLLDVIAALLDQRKKAS
jgi:transcriptional regulator with XRE-family HTH domain